MRIAICFSGGLRTFKLCYKDIVSHFEKLGEVNLFISTWENPGYTQVKRKIDIHAIEGESIFKELLNKDEKVTEEYLKSITNFSVIDIESKEVLNDIINKTKNMEWGVMSPSRLICQYYKMNRCNELKKIYAKENNINYDITVRVRCDIKIKSIPDKIDTNKIYINNMVYVNNPVFKHNMVNEMIYISNEENMDKLCNIYNNFNKLWWKDGYGEGVSFRNFLNEKLINKSIPYNFQLTIHRANGKVEKM